MGGGLMQLVAYGAQDIYLTGNPQITFFKVVYRRHTNFSMESIEQTWNGTTTSDGRCTATISRNGDLVSNLYLDISAGCDGNDGRNVGAAFIKTVEVEIGGQRIDRHSGKYMEAWAELTQPNTSGAVNALQANNASGVGTNFQNMSGMGGVVEVDVAARLHVPLQFWFCRNPGLALPLIALQYHEVKVTIQFGASNELTSETDATLDASLWADYIYLDTDERRRFAQVSHEYLIEQLQYQNFSNSASMDLTFNHPVKELIWTGVTTEQASASTTLGVSTPTTVGVGNWKLVLNGHDRMAERNHKYFTRTQVWQHHSGPGGVSAVDSIAVYSFALKPEEHQPSGTCNFSRIDNAQLRQTTGTTTAGANVYAVNYNVLRVMSGMGGLAYSN